MRKNGKKKKEIEAHSVVDTFLYYRPSSSTKSFSPQYLCARTVSLLHSTLSSCRNSRPETSKPATPTSSSLPTFARHFSSGTLARQSYSPFRHYVRPGCSIPSIWPRYIKSSFLSSLSLFLRCFLLLYCTAPPHPFLRASLTLSVLRQSRQVRLESVCSVENSNGEKSEGQRRLCFWSVNSRNSTRMWIPVEGKPRLSRARRLIIFFVERLAI